MKTYKHDEAPPTGTFKIRVMGNNMKSIYCKKCSMHKWMCPNCTRTVCPCSPANIVRGGNRHGHIVFPHMTVCLKD